MPITVTQDGPVTIVAINQPEKRNAVDPETAVALREAFAAFDSDAQANIAILTGNGGHFCAGFDLKAVGRSQTSPWSPGPMGPTRMLLSKPVIAAVEGYAVAGGLELALWCDMRVAAKSAIFGVFCRRWGVPLIDGGTIRLPRIIGQGRALDMILTGRPVDAEEAHRIGLADRLVEDGNALTAATTLAHQIAQFPQICLRSDRKSTYEQWDYALAQTYQQEGLLGMKPLQQEAELGASWFAAGAGRGGDFSPRS